MISVFNRFVGAPIDQDYLIQAQKGETMQGKPIFSFVIALIAAFLLTISADRRGFEEQAARALIAEQATVPLSKCPLSPSVIDKADIRLLWICQTYGMDAYNAARRYPAEAPRIFAVYGEVKEFRQILQKYGHQVIPVVVYFLNNGSTTFQVRQAIGDSVSRWWSGHGARWNFSSITREQIGLIAIHHIAIRGNEMLAEFEIVDGIAKRKLLTGLILGTKDLFLGGILDLEKILVRGERLPTLAEFGMAAADVVLVAGGVKVLTKAARIGADGAVGRGVADISVATAFKTIGRASWIGRKLGTAAVVYVAITRPGLLASAGGWFAEQLGLPRWLGVFAVYLLGLEMVFVLLRHLRWIGQTAAWPFGLFRKLFCFQDGGPLRSGHIRS